MFLIAIYIGQTRAVGSSEITLIIEIVNLTWGRQPLLCNDLQQNMQDLSMLTTLQRGARIETPRRL